MRKISVIVPVYKVEKYLRRCVDSILAQTFSDFELILVDDGSPDTCPAICDDYARKDSRVVVIHQANSGPSAARNAALEAARGEYIAFCDSDDYWAADFLAVLLHRMEETDADVVSCGFTAVTENGEFLYHTDFPEFNRQIGTPRDTAELMICDILGMKIGWALWTRLFRGDIIREHQLRLFSNFAEDALFILEYSLYCSRVATVDYVGYYYTQREDSLMQFGKQQVRLNAVNEISHRLGDEILPGTHGEYFQKIFPILHFYILDNQYKESRKLDGYRTLHKELQKIENQQWYLAQTKAVFGCKQELRELVGSQEACRAQLLTRLCLDGNRRKYILLSYLLLKENQRYLIRKILHK